MSASKSSHSNDEVSSPSPTSRPTDLANSHRPLGSSHQGGRQDPRSPLPDSGTFPISRKRPAALIDTDGGKAGHHHHHLRQHALSSPASNEPRSADPAAQICLCPPEQKIPRPRNAFMLYRQHFQASVVAQHPGLANPEISKIIGQQWKSEPQEVRDSWDALADEEKSRHHQQYPNYKYQPRRKGKKPTALNGATSQGSTAEDLCGKCGRRTITTPSTPGTPFTPRVAPPMLPPLASTMGSSAQYARDGYRQAPPMNTPISAPPAFHRRPSVPSPGIDMLQIRESLDEDVMTPLTPSYKRRRVSPFGWSQPYPQPARRSSLQGRMDPPPRPSSLGRSPDPSLTLPPLQTVDGKGVEAVVMTIPYLTKIKILSKISPPLAPPRPSGPAHPVRGAAVAIDGDDDEAIKEVTRWLTEELGRDEDMSVKTFDVDSDGEVLPDAGGDMPKGNEWSFGRYLESVIAWHKRSDDLVRFLTTVPATLTAATPTTESESAEAPSSTASAIASSGHRRTPVALIPSYMLTRSNQAAIRIPVRDAYAPPDHWQWVATLWRGIVGPDLTIWIRQCGRDEIARHGSVELREDTRALIVRKEEGKGIEARAQRRLVFEVGECIRTIGKVDGEEQKEVDR